MVSTLLLGRLANNLYCIYTIYYYCKKNNISYDKIVLQKENKKYVKDNLYVMTYKIRDKFIDSVDFNSLEKVEYSDKLNCLDNFYLSTFVWEWRNDFDLIYDLFIIDSYYDICKKYINYTDYLAIHVRRGDFVKDPGYQKYLYTKEQLNNCIQDNLNKYSKIVIFSEDIDWCRNNIEEKYFNKIVFHTRSDFDYKDLYIMSLCDNVIINRNSTFSMWGKRFCLTRKKLNLIKG